MNIQPKAKGIRPRPQITQPADPSYRLIVLTQGQVTTVDAEDYNWLIRWNWYAWWSKNGRCFYAVRTKTDSEDIKHGRVYMHRAIAAVADGLHVDHKDQNPLNNRRANLRPATRSQNLSNRPVQRDSGTGFKGVHFDKRSKSLYFASIKVNKKSIHLGTFKTAKEAALARDAAAIKLHGEFACLNFPVSDSTTPPNS